MAGDRLDFSGTWLRINAGQRSARPSLAAVALLAAVFAGPAAGLTAHAVPSAAGEQARAVVGLELGSPTILIATSHLMP